MSVNKYLPHIYVLPEDDANRQMANGFQLGELSDYRKMQVLNPAGGWNEVIKLFREEHISEMDRNEKRFIVLLIDFDEQENRLNKIKLEIPQRLAERVFVLGAWNNPEKLRLHFGPDYEKIGQAMAKDCHDNTDTTWRHNLLQHNFAELERMRKSIRSILFAA